MNRSPYRKLMANGKAALLAAIEIYNNPRIDYRDECFVILLLNNWELVFEGGTVEEWSNQLLPESASPSVSDLFISRCFPEG